MKNKSFHTSKSNKIGSGDYYGGGIRQPVGKIRSVFSIDVPNSMNTKKPPKTLA